jgi:hypothetical protein
MNNPTVKVVIEQTRLFGSSDDSDLQKLATVYVGRTGEYRVYAPARAVGSALEWIDHFYVHAPDEGGETVVPDSVAVHVINLIKQQLEIENEPAPERKKILESALHAAKDVAIDFLAKYAAAMSKP